jgi:hypothetical protein
MVSGPEVPCEHAVVEAASAAAAVAAAAAMKDLCYLLLACGLHV